MSTLLRLLDDAIDDAQEAVSETRDGTREGEDTRKVWQIVRDARAKVLHVYQGRLVPRMKSDAEQTP